MSDRPTAAPAEPVAAPPVEPVGETVPVAAVETAAPAAPISETPVAAEPSVSSPADTAEPSEGVSETPEATTLTPHTDEPGVLAATVEKPAEIEVNPAEEKPAEVKEPAEEPAPVVEPTVQYEPFTLPEGLELAGDGMERFTELAVAARLPQETAQQLVDMHVAAMQQSQANELAEQHRVFGELRRQWRTEMMADEEIGGAGFETNKSAAVRMLDHFVPEARRQAFNQAMVTTGIADHPEFMRFLVSVARAFDEPSPSPAPRNPPPDIGRNPGAGRTLNYNHPTSPQLNGAGS